MTLTKSIKILTPPRRHLLLIHTPNMLQLLVAALLLPTVYAKLNRYTPARTGLQIIDAPATLTAALTYPCEDKDGNCVVSIFSLLVCGCVVLLYRCQDDASQCLFVLCPVGLWPTGVDKSPHSRVVFFVTFFSVVHLRHTSPMSTPSFPVL